MTEDNDTKKCLKCGVVKPLSSFHAMKSARKGRRSQCKDCLRPWFREHYLKQVAADPDFKTRQNLKTHSYYHGMSAEKKREFFDRLRKRHEAIPNAALSKNLCRALRRRPTENHVTLNELIEIWKTQEGKCAVCGLTMQWAKGKYGHLSMSIDRIDCELGYTKDNVRLVCYAVNCFRGIWGDDVVLEMAKAIVANMEAKLVPA